MMGLMAGVLAAALGSIPTASARPTCVRRLHNRQVPVYDRRVEVFARRSLSCSQAAEVGGTVGDAYERGLPPSVYPRVPGAPANWLGHTFRVRTRYGTFTCRMLARGSDFIRARCRNGRKFTSFVSDNSWYLHGK